MSNSRLAGKNALIIGGSSGIGLALAKAFVAEGAQLAIAGRSQGKLTAAQEELGKAVSIHAADVSDPEALDQLYASVGKAMEPLDVLVNCQGTTVIKPSIEVTPAEYETVMQTNQQSVFFTTMRFGSGMIERGSGSIINIASLAAHRGWPRAAVYSMSKHAVLGLTRTLAAEWAEHGVRVNSISPGFFMTELNRARMSEDRKRTALARTPFDRFGELGELTGAAVFLASDDSAYVSGTDINVDGGYLASGI